MWHRFTRFVWFIWMYRPEACSTPRLLWGSSPWRCPVYWFFPFIVNGDFACRCLLFHFWHLGNWWCRIFQSRKGGTCYKVTQNAVEFRRRFHHHHMSGILNDLQLGTIYHLQNSSLSQWIVNDVSFYFTLYYIFITNSCIYFIDGICNIFFNP